MQNAGSFKCPHCAAPVPFQYGQHTSECEYCGSTVIVPPELQPPPPPQQPAYQYSQLQIVINGENVYTPQGQPQQLYTPQTTQRSKRGTTSCVSFLIFFIVLTVIAGAILTFVASSAPFFFDNLFGGGFARLEQTYGSDTATATTRGTSLGEVSDAVDVALDPEGNVYVVTYDGWVVRFAPDGSALTQWRVAGDDAHPDSIAVDGAGNVYLTVGTDLHKYEGATGAEIRTITVPEIFGMSDVALAPDGSILSFLGGQLDQVIRFDPTGMEVARYQRPITEYDPNTTTPPWLIRIATDTEGRIYLLNTSPISTAVYIYSSEGTHINHFGERGTGEGQFSSPGAIAVDSKGRIYISDSNSVNVYDQDGKYIGIIRMPFPYRANGLAFDKSDRLYAVARNESKVYRFVLNAP